MFVTHIINIGIMSKETTTLTKRSNEILRRIEEYFGESTHRVDAYQAGKVLELYIKYEDFEPKHKKNHSYVRQAGPLL